MDRTVWVGLLLEPLSVQYLSQKGVIHVNYSMNDTFLRRVMYNVQGISGSPGDGVVAASTEMPFLEPRHSLFRCWSTSRGILRLLREYI